MKKLLFSILYILVVLPSMAQQVPGKEIIENSQEKIILQTNRRFFLTGEILKFHIKTLAKDNSSPISRIAYMELVDKNREPVLRQKLKLENGTSDSEFYLPSVLPTGKYFLLAYTKWMQNYHKFPIVPISIVNPFRAIKNLDSPEISVDFHPESGFVALNTENTFVYRITGPKSFQPKELRILDKSGSTIRSVPCYEKQIGRFTWTPEQPRSYRVILISMNDEITYHDLSFKTSINHLAIKKEGNQILVTPFFDQAVRATIRYGSSSIPVRSGVEISVSWDKLEPGINIIQLATNYGIMARRPVLVPDYHTIISQLDKRNAAPRERMTLSLNSPEQEATVSVSIRHKDPSHERGSILDDLYFKPNGILVEEPAKYLTKNSLWEDIDNQMIMHHQSFLSEQVTDLQYLPEIRGMILSGRVTLEKTGDAVAEDVINLSVQDRTPRIFTSISDDKGYFKLLITDLVGDLDGYCTVHNGQKVEFYSNYMEDHEFLPQPEWSPDPELLSWIEKKSIEVQLENAYFEYKRDSVLRGVEKSIFYGEPNASYTLSEYTAFPTMKDVITEYVLGVGVRQRNGKPRISMIFNKNELLESDTAIIMINNVPMVNAESILDMNPSDVERIDVVYDSYVLGSMNAVGIVNFILKEGYSNNVAYKKNVHLIPIEGVSPPILKYKPDHLADPDSRIPDMRRDLYWNGSVKINSQVKEISFFCSDLEGEYEVIISGQTEGGKLIYQELLFEVNTSYE